MYIRIQQQTIRYRISRHEATQLTEGKSLEDSLYLSGNLKLSYSISPTTELSQFTYQPDTNRMALQINVDKLLAETSNRPSKQGIEITGHKFDENRTKIFLEVDIKK